MLNLVFPALPYSRTVDPMWQQEHDEAERRGYAVGLFDEEQNKFYGAGRAAYPALYRGWMLDEARMRAWRRRCRCWFRTKCTQLRTWPRVGTKPRAPTPQPVCFAELLKHRST